MPHKSPTEMMLEMVQTLDRLGIPYYVTGGMAVFVWGNPRFTADVDIVVHLSNETINTLHAALEKFCEQSYIDFEMMKEAFEHRGEFNYIDADSDVKVDFWVSGDAPFDRSCFERRIQREMLGHTLWFISPEDLVVMKLKWMQGGSYKSIDDLRTIFSKQFDKLDWPYIDRWVKGFGLKEQLQIAKAFHEHPPI